MGAAETFKQLPRAVRWAAIAGAAFVGYFAVAEPALEAAGRAEASAEVRAARLETWRRRADELAALDGEVAVGVSRHGAVVLPDTEGAGSAQLVGRVNEILDAHGVAARTATESVQALGGGPLRDVLGRDRPVQRLILRLQFTTTQESAAQIVAALERASEVVCVSAVSLRTDRESERLEATIDVEMWKVAEGRAR